MNLKSLPTKLTSGLNWFLVGVVTALLILAGSTIADLYSLKPQQVVTITRLKETKRSQELPSKTLECVSVQARDPAPKQQKKLEREFDIDFGKLELLSIRRIDSLPDGGEAALTLNKVTGEVEITVSPDDPKLFDWGGPLEIGAGIAYSMDHGKGFAAEIRKELLTIGKVNHVVFNGELRGELFPEALDPDNRSDIQVTVFASYRTGD